MNSSMRLPRRRFLIPFLVILAGWIFFHFQLNYHVSAFFRGDAYFQGKPTCYWNDQAVRLSSKSPPSAFMKMIHTLLPMLKISTPPDDLSIFGSYPEAVPVLLQMAKDETNNTDVRLFAATAVSNLLMAGHLAEHPDYEKEAVSFLGLERDNKTQLWNRVLVRIGEEWEGRWTEAKPGLRVTLDRIAATKKD